MVISLSYNNSKSERKKKKILFIKKIILILHTGNLIKMNTHAIEIAQFLLLPNINTAKKFSNYLWKLLASLVIAIKINEEIFTFTDFWSAFFQKFMRIQFSNYWCTWSKKKKIELIAKKTAKIIDRFILKDNDFILNLKYMICFEKIFRKVSNKAIFQKLHLINGILQYKIKTKDLIYLNRFFGTECSKLCQLWIISGKICPKTHFKWWRLLNIRETELEFLEQNIVLFCSSSKFRIDYEIARWIKK